MPKSSRRQKLTDEELKAENQKIRKEMAQNYTDPEMQKRIVETLSMRNIAAYAMVLFLPPVGIWYIWTRREKLYLNDASVYSWTFVGIVIFIGYLQLIWSGIMG
jgi:ABC-type methionine transport system permease subunit